jgi:DNA-binding IclR family transcriptional regulator
MEQVRTLTGATVSVQVPVRRTVVCVDGLVGPGAVARRIPLGETFPLHVTPGARVTLASLPDEEITRFVEAGTSAEDVYRPRRAPEIWSDVRAIRARGYAEDRGDYAPQSVASAIAFPILDINHEPHGSITAAGPADVFTRQLIHSLLPELQAIMAELNHISSVYVSNREPVP